MAQWSSPLMILLPKYPNWLATSLSKLQDAVSCSVGIIVDWKPNLTYVS